MLDFEILRKYGTTNERLRQLFTAAPPTNNEPVSPELQKDIDRRKQMEDWGQAQMIQGMHFSLKNYKLYAAADLMWDTTAINKDHIPLLMYAQGKIKLEHVVTELKDLKDSDKFIRKDEKGAAVGVDLPRFCESAFNLGRSIITRRHAAQSNKYSNLWPYYKYEPRGTGIVSKLRADVVSQVADIIVDNYDYRHHDSQVMRDMFLYGHSIDFVRCSWETERHWRKKVDEGGQWDGKAVESYIKKEGVSWTNPHPTRVFWDNAYPLASINSDTGCTYIGFWDACRYADIAENPLYFNRDHIPYQRTQGLWGLWNAYPAYFNQYLNQLTPPSNAQPVDPSSENDRLANIGVYSGDVRQASIFVADIYRRIVPKDWGIGDYPFPVWIRMKFASDKTIIFSEIMPSTPAAYCGYNEDDSRQLNVATSHNLMAYQDQMSNLLTALLLAIQQDQTKVFALNVDAFIKDGKVDDKGLQMARDQFKGDGFGTKPIVIEYSAARNAENGIDSSKIVTLAETRAGQSITSIIQGMAQLLQLVERLEAMSPNEQGQPAPREISATEVNEIANTTSNIYSFISDAIDEFRAAKKRILYESYVAMSQEEKFVAPVVNRYSEKTIKKAGFDIVPDEDENYLGDAKRRVITGTKHALRHNYVFTTRDGAERPVNTQAANTLVQLVAQLVNVPTMLRALGKEKLYEIFNDIFRLSGCGVDLNLELKEGEDDSFGQDQAAQLTQFVQQLAEQVKANTEDVAQVEQSLPQMAEMLKQAVAKTQEMEGKLPAQEQVKIPYDKAPPQIQRQMEAQAGYTPAVVTQPVTPQTT